MQKIFVTYGDAKFELSKKQLLKEAKALGIFEEVIGFGPNDLPAYIASAPLMAYKRGGGYWCWKPWVIWNTMQKYPDAIVVYADSGCVLHNTPEWNEWFTLMETHDALVTYYRDDVDYGWKSMYPGMNVSPAIAHWTKNNTLSYFGVLFGNEDWHQYNKIWAGFVMAKNNSRLIREWLDITLFYPRYVMDPIGVDAVMLHADYVAHRHDQSILTPLAYWLKNQNESFVAIIPETGELSADAAVVTARRVVKAESLKTRLSLFFRHLLGESLYHRMWR